MAVIYVILNKLIHVNYEHRKIGYDQTCDDVADINGIAYNYAFLEFLIARYGKGGGDDNNNQYGSNGGNNHNNSNHHNNNHNNNDRNHSSDRNDGGSSNNGSNNNSGGGDGDDEKNNGHNNNKHSNDKSKKKKTKKKKKKGQKDSKADNKLGEEEIERYIEIIDQYKFDADQEEKNEIMKEESTNDMELTDQILKLLHEANKDQLNHKQLIKRLQAIPIKSLIIASEQITKFKAEFDGLRRMYHINIFRKSTNRAYQRSQKSCYALCVLRNTQNKYMIPRQLSSVTIPSQIRERIPSSEVYWFMLQSIFMKNNNCVIENGEYRVFDFNFHDTEGQSLYALAYRLDKKWQLGDRLFSHNELWTKFEVVLDEHIENKFKRIEHNERIIRQKTEQLMNNKDIVINKTKWSKVPVYKRNSNRKSVKLTILNDEFESQCHDYVRSQQNDAYQIIPIVIFDKNGKDYHIEYVWIISIEFENINIGISFKVDNDNNNNNGLKVSGIHLDKQFLQHQHLLVNTRSCANGSGCHCFDNFTSYIDDLRIGNLKEEENKTRDVQRRSEMQKVQDKLERDADLKELDLFKRKAYNLDKTNIELRKINRNLQSKHKEQQHLITKLTNKGLIGLHDQNTQLQKACKQLQLTIKQQVQTIAELRDEINTLRQEQRAKHENVLSISTTSNTSSNTFGYNHLGNNQSGTDLCDDDSYLANTHTPEYSLQSFNSSKSNSHTNTITSPNSKHSNSNSNTNNNSKSKPPIHQSYGSTASTPHSNNV